MWLLEMCEQRLNFLNVLFAGPNFPEFLLPFRKPKRIRTAFSPNQLLKLEQAFEKNQYVVGQERKELAKNLNLSETQVSWRKNTQSTPKIPQKYPNCTQITQKTHWHVCREKSFPVSVRDFESRHWMWLSFDIWGNKFENCILAPRVKFRGN